MQSAPQTEKQQPLKSRERLSPHPRGGGGWGQGSPGQSHTFSSWKKRRDSDRTLPLTHHILFMKTNLIPDSKASSRHPLGSQDLMDRPPEGMRWSRCPPQPRPAPPQGQSPHPSTPDSPREAGIDRLSLAVRGRPAPVYFPLVSAGPLQRALAGQHTDNGHHRAATHDGWVTKDEDALSCKRTAPSGSLVATGLWLRSPVAWAGGL